VSGDSSGRRLLVGVGEMRDRQTTLLWMKDLIDHMARCQEQLQWANEGPSARFLTDALLVDLTECQKLCERLKGPARAAAMARA
jgi:hypothetical protein